MPTYEYRCEACKHQVEVFAKMSDPPPAACEECGGVELVKVLFPVAVHYKGSGFYSTDYGSKRASGGSDSSGESSSGESKSTSSEGGSSTSTETSSAGSGASSNAGGSGSSSGSASTSSSD